MPKCSCAYLVGRESAHSALVHQHLYMKSPVRGMVRVDWHAHEYGSSVCPTDEYSTHCMVIRSEQPVIGRQSTTLNLDYLFTMSPRVAPEGRLLFLIAVYYTLISTPVRANFEGDQLWTFRSRLIDPSGALQNWDKQVMNPCSWFHVTCNAQNSVIRVDLGNAGLSGTLVPELEYLKNLQYLELYSNNFSGPIPKELGNLDALVSLDLYQNNFTGPIPDTLGQLSNLRFLRMNNNSLDGPIPASLTAITRLQVLDLSYNNLTGEVPTNGSFSLFPPSSFIGNKLCGSAVGIQCPGHPPIPLPAPNTQSSPQTQEPKSNRKVIILATTISAAVLMIVIVGFTFIICRNKKNSGNLQKNSKVANIEGRKY